MNLPLAGRVSLNYEAANTLAETLDTIQRNNVELLNFAFLDMEGGGRDSGRDRDYRHDLHVFLTLCM